MDVFVSYKSDDRALVATLVTNLRRAGLAVWWDRDIAPNAAWEATVEAELQAAKCVIVCWTKASVDPDGGAKVQVEAREALEQKKLLQALLDPVKPPLFFRQMQAVDLSAWDGTSDSGNIQVLIQAARDVLAGTAPALTPGAWRRRRPPRLPQLAVDRRVAIGGATAAGAALLAGGGWWLTRTKSEGGVVFDPSAVAVFPFANGTGQASFDFLCTSLPDELGRLLTMLTTVPVRPFTEVRRIAQSAQTASAALALGAGRAVTGTLSSQDGILTFAITIYDVLRQVVLSTVTTTKNEPNLLEAMTRVVAKAGGFLQKTMAIESAHAIDTGNDRAYVAYLRAIALQQEITKENIGLAIQNFEQAVELDPQFARAFAELAKCCVTSFYWGLAAGTAPLERAQKAADRATSLRPDLAESHFALAATLEAKGNRKAALRAYLTSFRANPRYADTIESIARFLFYMAQFDRSIEMWDELARIDATSNKPRIRRAMCHYFKGDPEQARTENVLAEQSARGVDEFTLIAFTYAWIGDVAAAERMLVRLQTADPTAMQIAEIRAWILIGQGKLNDARKGVEALAAQYGSRYGIKDELAAFYALLGDKDRAASLLKAAVAEGAPNYAWYRSDWFKSIRDDKRYKEVLSTLNAEYQELKEDMRNLP